MDWKLKELTGLFYVFLLIDLGLLIFRNLYPNFVWPLVSLIFIVQMISLFIMNTKSNENKVILKNFYLFLVMFCSFVFIWLFSIFIKNGTIVQEIIEKFISF